MPMEMVPKFVRKLIGWGRKYSLWPAHLVTGCCSPEFMQVAGPRYDTERFGLLPMPAIRQSDVLMIIGQLSRKMAQRVKMLYDQMPEPKYVVAIGACALGKGPFYDSYALVKAEDVVPVDFFVPGCPPRPEAMIQAIIMLQKKVVEDTESGKG